MYVVIAGCGRVGARLATLLSAEGHNVVIIDSNPNAFSRLGSSFNGLTVTGNGFDEGVLRKAGIEQADVFVAVTEFDNANIMAGQVAKKLFNVPKVVARVYYPDREQTYHRLGLETICGTTIVAERIRNWILGREFISEISLNFQTQIVEFRVSKKLAGKHVSEIEQPDFRPFVILRGKESLLASSDTFLRENDIVLAAVRSEAVSEIEEHYGVRLASLTTSGLSCPLQPFV
jgi:trk system potassium uptake protein TrkA